MQTLAAQSVNRSETSALPITAVIEDEDVERGVASSSGSRSGGGGGMSWRSLLGRERERERVPEEDRNR